MGLSPNTQLVYSFLELPHTVQRRIGLDLELVEANIRPSDDRVVYGRAIFTAALADDKMAELWDLVARAEASAHERSLPGEGRLAGQDNPFRGLLNDELRED